MRNRTGRNEKKAVVLLSGGLDSSTVLYTALEAGYRVYCLIFDYGQRHRRELRSARRIASSAGCPYAVVRFSLPWKGSSLLDPAITVPDYAAKSGIPNTYVPARNMIFLSFAVSYAETAGAEAVFIGANAIDYSGYPDCRPVFLSAFGRAASMGTKAGVEGRKVSIKAPLLKMTKADIVKQAVRLGVPLHLTWSCYKGGTVPCGKCDSCVLRARGFAAAHMTDPVARRMR